MAKIKFKCKVCNKEVIDYPSNKIKYCSVACRNKDWQGKNNPNFNKKWTEEKKARLSAKILNQFKNSRVVWNKNLTKEDSRVMKYIKPLYGNKFGSKNKGKKSEWTRIRNLTNNPMSNIDARKKMRETLKRLYAEGKIKAWNKGFGDYCTGEKSSNWKGGISKEPYGLDWTRSKKKRIRALDEYRCQRCGRTQEEQMSETRQSLSVHHIDGNKKNCSDDNLVTLCIKCNVKIEYLPLRPNFKETIERRKLNKNID